MIASLFHVVESWQLCFTKRTQQHRGHMSLKKLVLIPRAGCTELVQRADYENHSDSLVRRWEEMLEEVETNQDGCWICEENLNSQGYPRIRYSVPGVYRCWSDGACMIWENIETGKTRRKLVDFRTTAHSYVYWCEKGTSAQGNGMDISHLCANKKCVNIEHLCLEPHAYNLGRIGCRTRNGPCSHIPNVLVNKNFL